MYQAEGPTRPAWLSRPEGGLSNLGIILVLMGRSLLWVAKLPWRIIKFFCRPDVWLELLFGLLNIW